MDVVSGFNSDLQVRGFSFHVQTEDWGVENPFIVSRVFYQGAVLRTFKTPYTRVIGDHVPDASNTSWQKYIGIAVKSQHEQVLDFVMKGQISP